MHTLWPKVESNGVGRTIIVGYVKFNEALEISLIQGRSTTELVKIEVGKVACVKLKELNVGECVGPIAINSPVTDLNTRWSKCNRVSTSWSPS